MLVVLAGGFVAVVVDGTGHRSSLEPGLVVELTRLPGAALSVHYFEPRIRPYADFSSTVHPDLAPPSAMDFVYER